MELTKEQLQAGRAAILKNAGSLVKEAKLLLHSGRNARCIALSQAAGEELGKFVLFTSQLVDVVKGAEPTIPWQAFWKYFKDHKAKTKLITFLEDVLLGIKVPATYHAELKQGAAELEKYRQWMMYVDWIENSFMAPDDLVAVEIAQHALKWAQGRLTLITSAFNVDRGIDHLTAEALRTSEARLRKRLEEE